MDLKITSKNGLFLLSGIPFHLDVDKISAKFKIPHHTDEFSILKDMIEGAFKTGIPKAVYRIGYIDRRTEDSVVINGTEFRSRVLRVNLENSERVFMYVVSCGMELENWSMGYSDPFFSYIADYIKESVLHSAVIFFFNYIKETYKIPKFSKIAPGSLNDWPIEQQRQLFSAIGDVKNTAGVILTDSLLMVPSKSVSGILYPSEVSFESCMLCQRENCPSRRATYDSSLYERKYRET